MGLLTTRNFFLTALLVYAVHRYSPSSSPLGAPSSVTSKLSAVLAPLSSLSLAGAPELEEEDPQPTRYRHRIIAIGDLHGDLAHALRCLRLAGVVDLRGRWIAKGGLTLVQTGDIVDRGDDTIALYRLFDRLREEAPKFGGRVISLLGNHEIMSASGDWRYATRGDIASFGGERGRRRAMSSEGWLGKAWMANYSTTARVPYPITFPSAPAVPLTPDSTLESTSAASVYQILNSPPQIPFFPVASPASAFEDGEFDPDMFALEAASFVHGGLTAKYAKLGVSEINRLGYSLLNRSLTDAAGASPVRLPKDTPPEERDFYGADGPVWYRGWALREDEETLCAEAEEVCRLLGVRRLVMGHTPIFEGITSRCHGRIVLIDTGISSAYGGAISALDITYSLTPQIPMTTPAPSPDAEAQGEVEVPVPVKIERGEKLKWVEREVVAALQEGKPKVTLARRERTLEIAWYP